MSQLVELGWSPSFAEQFTFPAGTQPARVIAEHRSCYRIVSECGECGARISGRLRHETTHHAELPAVGDWVCAQLAETASAEATILAVLPRKSKFSRKVAGDRTEEQIVAANIDYVWIVMGLDQDYSLRRLERYLTLAWESGASPVIVLNKSDLCDDHAARAADVESIAVGTPTYFTSSLLNEGIDDLRRYLQDHATVALLGSSGVGKSTMINAIAGTSLQQTGDVRGDGKGRHTTTHRQLISIPGGGLIVDSPGMRELQLWGSSSGLDDTFGEIEELATNCRFADCRHESEPGCAVIAAIDAGNLDAERLVSYHKLQREFAHLDRKQDKQAQLEQKRQFKNANKRLKNHLRFKRQ